jgi:hypothetical protein
MLPLFLAFGLGGSGVRMLAQHSSFGSVVVGLLFVLAGLASVAGLAAYLSRPVK